MLTKLNQKLSDPTHTVFIAFLMFLIEQMAQVPLDKLASPHVNILNVSIGIMMIIIAVYWDWQLIYQNKAVNTKYNFYDSLEIIIINIIIILILAQAWAKIAIPLWHLPIGGTSENQNAIMAMNKNLISHIYQITFAAVIAPMIEEILFHYAIIGPKDHLFTTKANYKIMQPWTNFQNLHPKRARFFKMIISIILFALIHMLVQILDIRTHQQAMAALYETVQYLIISVVFSINYYRRNNIFENIGMHIAYNSFVLLNAF